MAIPWICDSSTHAAEDNGGTGKAGWLCAASDIPSGAVLKKLRRTLFTEQKGTAADDGLSSRDPGLGGTGGTAAGDIDTYLGTVYTDTEYSYLSTHKFQSTA